MSDLSKKLDKACELKSLPRWPAPPSARCRASTLGDAEHLKAAFGIDTIRGLGTNKYVRWTQAITSLADQGEPGGTGWSPAPPIFTRQGTRADATSPRSVPA